VRTLRRSCTLPRVASAHTLYSKSKSQGICYDGQECAALHTGARCLARRTGARRPLLPPLGIGCSIAHSCATWFRTALPSVDGPTWILWSSSRCFGPGLPLKRPFSRLSCTASPYVSYHVGQSKLDNRPFRKQRWQIDEHKTGILGQRWLFYFPEEPFPVARSASGALQLICIHPIAELTRPLVPARVG